MQLKDRREKVRAAEYGTVFKNFDLLAIEGDDHAER
jgi:hypothetical protein